MATSTKTTVKVSKTALLNAVATSITSKALATMIANANKGHTVGYVFENEMSGVCAASKKAGIVVTKRSEGSGRLGNAESYALRINKLRKAKAEKEGYDYTPYEPKGLPFGEWVEGFEGQLIQHTLKSGETRQYIRFYMYENQGVEVTYAINGQPATLDEVEKHLIPSAQKKARQAQRDAEKQRLDVEQLIDVRCPMLTTIKRITLEGQTFNQVDFS